MNNFYHKKILKLAEKFIKKAEERDVAEYMDNYISGISENLILLEQSIKENKKIDEQGLAYLLELVERSTEAINGISENVDNFINKINKIFFERTLLQFSSTIQINIFQIANYLSYNDLKSSYIFKTIKDIDDNCKGLENFLSSHKVNIEQINPDTLSEEDVIPGFFEDEEPDAEEKINQLNKKNYMTSIEDEQEKLQKEKRKYMQENSYDSSEEDYYEKRYSNY